MLPSTARHFAKIEKQREALCRLVEALPPSELRRPTKAGWSVLQEVHHLALSDEELLRRAREEAGRSHVHPVKSRVATRMGLTVMKLRIPIPIPTETVVPPVDVHLAETLTIWEAARQDLHALASEVVDPRHVFATHPRLGPFNVDQALRMVAAHTDYHAVRVHKTVPLHREIRA